MNGAAVRLRGYQLQMTFDRQPKLPPVGYRANKDTGGTEKHQQCLGELNRN
jgi:hypothetical protein